MSAGPWTIPQSGTEPPYGFRVTIERVVNGTPEIHQFPSKTSRAAAVQKASYKNGFLRLVAVDPLTRDAWEREFGGQRSVVRGQR
jgi:hypothetical protein